MNCPYCNKEMKKGYIEQSDFRFPLKWCPDDVNKVFLKSNKGNIKLTSVFNTALTVHYCGDCKRFIINQEEIDI